MAKEFCISLRRFAAIAFILLLVSFGLSVVAAAQQVQIPAPPYVITSAGFSPAHTFNSGPSIKGCAIAKTGDVVCADVVNNHLWHIPVDGRPVQDVGWISSEHSWKNNFGVGIDSKMNLYVGGNYAINGIYKVPYDPVAKTWNMANAIAFINGGGLVPDPPGFTQTCGNNNCWGFQPSVVAVDANDNLVVGTTGGAPTKYEIFTVPVNPDGTANLAGGQLKVWGMKNRPDWLTVDAAGNIYFVVEGYAGVLMLPAGQTALTGTGDGTLEIAANGLPTPPLVRLDMLAADSPAEPDAAQPAKFRFNNNIQGVAVDAAGNVYYGDANDSFNDPNLNGGIWMVPNEDGTLKPAHTVFIAPIPTPGGLAIDNATGALWAAVPGSWNGLTDIAKFTFGTLNLGEVTVGNEGSTVTIFNAFNNDESVAIPDDLKLSFKLRTLPSGVQDFQQIGGSCGNAFAVVSPPLQYYHQNDRCSVTIAAKPTVLGQVEGQLMMEQVVQTGEDANHNPVYVSESTTPNATLHVMGKGGALAFLNSPAETTMGTGITSMDQLTTDKAGNVFAASSARQEILEFAPGAILVPIELGKGNFTAPTGVALDGMGFMYIADSNQVFQVPYQQDAYGNWLWNFQAKVAIKTGLGGSVKLAANAAGYLFVADPDNHRVLKFRIYYSPTQEPVLKPTTGLTVVAEQSFAFETVTGIGLDAAGNLLVGDGMNAILVDERGEQTTIAANIGPANALALDPSGGLYYSTATGAFRVPIEGGGLNVADKRALGTGVTAVTGLALDRKQNVYLADATAANLHVVTVNGTLAFGTISLGDHPLLDSQVFNIGNDAVTFAVDANGQFPHTTDGWHGITSVNFTTAGSAANGCDGVTPTPLPSGSSCFVATTFNPDAGQEGPLTGQITMSGNVANAPVILNTTGTGAALTQTTAQITVGANANANSAPVTATITHAAGTSAPTGDVLVLIDGVVKGRTALGADGVVSWDLKPVKAGSHEYRVSFTGDRSYGRATDAKTPNIAKGATSVLNPPLVRDLSDPTAAWIPYVLARNQGAENYYYQYPVSVIAGPAEEHMVPTPTECHNTSLDICGKTVLVDASKAVQSTQKLDENKGTAVFPSSGLVTNPDSTVLHPVTEYTVVPVYLGDDNYQQSAGQPITFEVVRIPSVWIDRADGSGAITLAAGSTATASFTAKSMFGYGDITNYTGQVEFQCDNLPPYSSCTFEPARVTVNSTTVGHTTVTIATNVPVGAVTAKNHDASSLLFAAMFGLGMVGLVFGKTKKVNSRILMLICAALIVTGAVAGMTACGTSTGANPNPPARTPSGNYAVTITAVQIGGYIPQGQQGWQQNWAAVPLTVNVKVQ